MIKILVDPEKAVEIPEVIIEEGKITLLATNITDADLDALRFMMLLPFQVPFWPFEEPTLEQISSAYSKLLGKKADI
jgi:hypothetical protein